MRSRYNQLQSNRQGVEHSFRISYQYTGTQ
jgi:hypothetical protein